MRTKTRETVETGGNCWPRVANIVSASAEPEGQFWPFLVTPGISCPRPGSNYGSEGWGFESLRARCKSPGQRVDPLVGRSRRDLNTQSDHGQVLIAL
jgi:hypothetical protein